MILQKWNLINADNVVIDSVFTGTTGDQKRAYEKAKIKYGKTISFIQIKKAETVNR